MKKIIVKLQKGFTIIELLISMAILVMLLSLVLANFGGLSKQRNLNIARNNIISDLRYAQSQSLSSKNVSGSVVASQRGVSFQVSASPPSTYAIFADDNTANQNRTVYETKRLPGNVYIKQISVSRFNGSNTTANNLEVMFTVPYGRLMQTFSGGGASATKEGDDLTTITLSSDDNTLTATIMVNGTSGLISQ